MPKRRLDDRSSEELAGILVGPAKDFVTFELLEDFASAAHSKKDVLRLLAVLKGHANGIVRHEAAAQIAELWRKRSELLMEAKPLVVRTLLDCARDDPSTTARHEAIETLGYLGDRSILKQLKTLSTDANPDIRATARIAIGLVNFRIRHPGPDDELGKRILEVHRGLPKT